MSNTRRRFKPCSAQRDTFHLFHLLLLIWFLVVESKQMQRAMHGQQRELISQRHCTFPGAARGHRQRDHDFAKFGRTVRPAQSVEIRIEREDIRRRVLPSKPAIQSAHRSRIGHVNGDDSRDSQFPRGERLSHAALKSIHIDAVDKGGIDLDVYVVPLRRHIRRIWRQQPPRQR